MVTTVTALVLMAFGAHQIFKRYETYSIRLHLALLFIPPVVASLYTASNGSTLPSLLLTHLTYIGSLALFIVIHRVSPLHPLACHPGPIACKVSQWWMAYVSLSGYEHLYIAELHRKYGDVVRIGPNEISICDAAAAGPVMGIAAGLPKGPQYYGRMLSDGKNLPLIGIQDIDEHLRRRRPWNRALGASALRDYEQTIAARARQLVGALERQVSAMGPQDDGRPGRECKVILGEWFNRFAYDFMCDMAFGGGSELLESEGKDGDNVWKILDEGMVVGTFLAHVPWLGVYLSHIPLATGALDRLISHCRSLTKQRIRRGASRKDLFHFINNEDMADGEEVPMRQLTNDGCLVVVAGADTTSSAMTSLFYCLLTHPEMYARLQEEVDRFYPPGEDALDTKFHRDMDYLNAVINETLRLYPPVPMGSQRQVPHNGSGVQVGATYIAPRTSVYVHTYSLHRDSRNFSPHPDAFWPDRWLIASGVARPTATPPNPNSNSCFKAHPTPSSEPQFVHNEAAFIPFAAGAMNCVGKGLALQEIRMVVCALVQRFEMRLREGWDAGEYERGLRAYLVATRPELPVLLKVRRTS